VVTGLVDMRPELVTVHTAAGADAAADQPERRAEPAPAMAEMSAGDFIQRKPPEEVKELTGSDLRRRFVAAEPEEPAVPKKGLLARLFGRSKALDKAA
jgi:hypothetical protein